MKTSRRKTLDPARSGTVVSLLSLGFADYVAARVLLNARLPLQGAVLASTAVEKHLKAILAVRGELNRSHLKMAHLRSLKNFSPDLARELNPTFMEFLQRVYSLRYHDNLTPGFNACICCRMTLAELDFTVAAIRSTIRLDRGGEPLLTSFDIALQEKNPLLFENNHVLSGEAKESFLSHPDFCYEVRVRYQEPILEAYYSTFTSRTDGDFLVEALRPVSSEELERMAQEEEAMEGNR